MILGEMVLSFWSKHQTPLVQDKPYLRTTMPQVEMTILIALLQHGLRLLTIGKTPITHVSHLKLMSVVALECQQSKSKGLFHESGSRSKNLLVSGEIIVNIFVLFWRLLPLQIFS